VSVLRRALVVSTGKNSAWVSLDGEPGPRIAQLRRMTGKRFMPVPGDIVHVRVLEDERVVVDEMEPRSFALERRTAGGRSKTMAANVDSIVTVISLGDPPPRLTTLDQLLAFAELESVAAMVVMTKPDRGEAPERERLTALYSELGYRVIVVNPKTGENVDGFRDAIRGHRALLTGVSGVGKSTIFRALGGEAIVGDVSRHGLGRQTTTTARLYRMGDGFLIDSPGVNEFGLGDISATELAPLFREMVEPAVRCRFNDCTHLHEPDCAVLAAAAAGLIAESRYASYRKILLEPT
jgi:ribosome biogenesis GTPase